MSTFFKNVRQKFQRKAHSGFRGDSAVDATLSERCVPAREVITHYENSPIQIYRKFHLQKTENFPMKNSDIFHISAQNIDCGYLLEPPRRGGSNEYPQSIFF